MKDILLFIDAIRPATFEALDIYEKQSGRKFKPVVLVDKKIQMSITDRNGQKALAGKAEVIAADFDSPHSIRRALHPYQDRIFAVTAQYENAIHELRKLIPYVPYLQVPTEKSLLWATEKKHMRTLMEAYDPSLVPGYMEVYDNAHRTIADVEAKLKYPVIVKPSGLEGSLLVTMAKNRKELQVALGHVFQEIQAGYNTWIKRQQPRVLVEEFMAGDMYSIDVYVDANGTCRHAPIVEVVTGKKVGFDDFFGYVRITPTGLPAAEIKAAQRACESAVHALCLRSVTVHVELMHTATGWKIIEVGPRIGGYRHDLYRLSYGMNHIMNDIRNRAGEEPEIPTKAKEHTAVFNIYAREQGILQSVLGVEEVEALESFVSMRQVLDIGQIALFAKNNGDAVFEVILSNKNPKQLQADIASMERALVLKIRVLEPALAENMYV